MMTYQNKPSLLIYFSIIQAGVTLTAKIWIKGELFSTSDINAFARLTNRSRPELELD